MCGGGHGGGADGGEGGGGEGGGGSGGGGRLGGGGEGGGGRGSGEGGGDFGGGGGGHGNGDGGGSEGGGVSGGSCGGGSSGGGAAYAANVKAEGSEGPCGRRALPQWSRSHRRDSLCQTKASHLSSTKHVRAQSVGPATSSCLPSRASHWPAAHEAGYTKYPGGARGSTVSAADMRSGDALRSSPDGGRRWPRRTES